MSQIFDPASTVPGAGGALELDATDPTTSVRVPLTPLDGYAILLREKPPEKASGGVLLPQGMPIIDPRTGRPAGPQTFTATGEVVGQMPYARVLKLGGPIPAWKEGMIERGAPFKVGDRVLLTNNVSRFTHHECDGNVLEVAPFEAVIAVLDEE